MSKEDFRGKEMDNLASRIEGAEVAVQMLGQEKDELLIRRDKAKARLTKLRNMRGAQLVARVQFTAIDGVTHQQLETAIHNVLLNQVSTITDKIAAIDRVTVRAETPQ